MDKGVCLFDGYMQTKAYFNTGLCGDNLSMKNPLVEVQAGQKGVEFLISVVDSYTWRSLDLSGFDLVELVLSPPYVDAVPLDFNLAYPCTVVDLGLISYTTTGVDFSVIGLWSFQIRASSESNAFLSGVLNFRVLANVD